MRVILENRPVARAAATFGLLAHLAAFVLYVILPALVVPLPVLYGFAAAWILVLALAVHWIATHPWRTALVPLLGAVVVGLVRIFGEQHLGWRG